MTKRVTFIELELIKCQNTYGVAPCTAAVGVTGEDKCFNCRSTCQDLPNIVEANEVVRFSKPSSNIRFDLNATPNITIPNVVSVDYSPPVLDLGGGLGVRATLSVSLADSRSPDTDASGDRYVSERNYDPYSQGTYLGKLRARYPFLRGQIIRWVQGTDDQNIADMETRTFVVDSIAGPGINGGFSITAKDILKLTDGDQSLAPNVSDLKLDSALTAVYTGNIPVGAGNALLFENLGYAVLGGVETVKVERLASDPANSTITILNRGQRFSEAVEHEADASIQPALKYDPQSPADILYDLIVNQAGIDPVFVPYADWQLEATDYINRNYSALICQPTAVRTLLTELITQTASAMWWDNQAQLIRWQVLKQPAIGSTVFSDLGTKGGTFNIKDDYTRRVSRCLIYFGQRNPLLKIDDTENYATTVLRHELGSEANFQGVPAYRQIFSRWISAPARDTAERLGDLILQRFSIPPRKVGFRLHRDSGGTIPELGGSYRASNFMLQKADGSEDIIPIQVSSLLPGETSFTVEAEEITFNSVIAPDNPNIVPVSLDNNEQNINLRDKYNSAGGPVPTALTVVNFSISTGVTIGSSSANSPAITVGDWPAGVTLNLINNGMILGAGGKGAVGASITLLYLVRSNSRIEGTNAGNGGDGGPAIEITHDINITNNGVIGGGGGGGGGGAAAYGAITSSVPEADYDFYLGYCAGPGGGGGSGSSSGSGGDSGSVSNVYSKLGVTKDASYTPPQPALAGAPLLGGDAFRGSSVNTVEFEGMVFSYSGAQAGKGGNLGLKGEDGSDDASQNPPSGIYARYRSNGPFKPFNPGQGQVGLPGLGGQAGPAIIQNGGTANILTAGDIHGSII